jgi:hypothetical protein
MPMRASSSFTFTAPPPLIPGDFFALIPLSVATVGQILDRTKEITSVEPLVYFVHGVFGPEDARPLYAGMTQVSSWERFRRHCARRKLGTDISFVDQVMGAAPWSRTWDVTIAPPADFSSYAVAALDHLRRYCRERGELPARLDAKLDTLLAAPETWATARVIERVLIATGEPVFNRKGNVYAGRPLALLRAFLRMVATEARRTRD